MMAIVGWAIVSRVRRTIARRARIVVEDIVPLAQATAAATVAWLVAKLVIDHHEPFFAPIAALVALNQPVGERGLNALRVLEGVLVGIGVGELTLLVLHGGYGSLALGTFVSLVLARALGNARLLLAQSAVAAILTIASANGQVGTNRLIDALVGAGVALVFTQFVFSPHPIRLLRRVETDALAAMADGLELTARSLEGDEELAERAIAGQRELRDHLSELARMRKATPRVARHSLVWRGQIATLRRENEDAGHLDLLGGSCLLLTRTTLGTLEEDRALLAPCIRELSATLGELAQDPGAYASRQRAVDRSLETLRKMRALRAEPDADLTAVLTAARIAVADLMLFVGVDPDVTSLATRETQPTQQTFEVRGLTPAERRFRMRGRRPR
jgi:uncharacterized membrane protein YgaE (UPF0421/DUF939 family)